MLYTLLLLLAGQLHAERLQLAAAAAAGIICFSDGATAPLAPAAWDAAAKMTGLLESLAAALGRRGMLAAVDSALPGAATTALHSPSAPSNWQGPTAATAPWLQRPPGTPASWLAGCPACKRRAGLAPKPARAAAGDAGRRQGPAPVRIEQA